MLKNLNYITNNWSEKWVLYLFLYYEMHDDFWVLSYWQLLVYLISTEKRNSKGKYSSWVGYWTWKENNFQKEFQPEEFCQEGVLKFFAKIRRNPQCPTQVFSWNFAQFLGTLFLIEHLQWLFPNAIYFLQSENNKKEEQKDNSDSLVSAAWFAAFHRKIILENYNFCLCRIYHKIVKIVFLFFVSFLSNSDPRFPIFWQHEKVNNTNQT